MKSLILALLSAFLAVPAFAAAPLVTADALGHKRVLNEGGAAPSPNGTVFTFQPYDADIEVMLQGTGSNNDSGLDEHALVGFSGMLFVGRKVAVGVNVARPDAGNPDWLRVAPTAKLYLGDVSNASWLKFVKFQPFSYNFAMGNDAGFSGGAFSTDMRLTGGGEFPLGDEIAFQLEIGALATFTSLSQDVVDTVNPMLGGTFVYRIRPKPKG